MPWVGKSRRRNNGFFTPSFMHSYFHAYFSLSFLIHLKPSFLLQFFRCRLYFYLLFTYLLFCPTHFFSHIYHQFYKVFFSSICCSFLEQTIFSHSSLSEIKKFFILKFINRIKCGNDSASIPLE